MLHRNIKFVIKWCCKEFNI